MNEHLDYDWFPRSLPSNIQLSESTYIASSYAFETFFSELEPGLVMEEGSGAYNLCSLETGPRGFIRIGAFTCLNSANIIAHESVTIGAHCLFAWGAVISDSVIPAGSDLRLRQAAMREGGSDPFRRLRPHGRTAPVQIDDTVWVGFDSVIMGGVRIGRGAIIGCKTVIREDIPPYAIVVGNPPRIVRFLTPNDEESSRRATFREFGLLSLDRSNNYNGH